MRKIYLLPIGKVKIDFLNKLLLQLEERFFYKFEVLNPVPVPRNSYNSEKDQYEAELILKGTSRYMPKDTKVLLGIVDIDIFTDKFNFTFGYTTADEKTGIVSICRLRPQYYGQEENENILHERALKEVVHELGHLLGIKHCHDKTCIMYSTSNVFDIDSKNTFLCEGCQKKIKKETKSA